MRIDFHVHLSPRENLLAEPARFCDEFWEGRGEDWSALIREPARFEGHMADEGVDYAVGLAERNPEVTGVTTNEEVWERYRESKKVLMFATFNAGDGVDFEAEAHRLAGLGFRGMKLYPSYSHFYPNDPRLGPLYRAAQELGWPVMVHTGTSVFAGSKVKYGDPVLLDDVAVDYPKLNLLIVHGGRGLWYQQAQTLVSLHENVHLEVSGLPPHKLMEYFPKLASISHKTIFGSDWPANPGIRRNMELLSTLPLGARAIDDILGNNAARLLGLQ